MKRSEMVQKFQVFVFDASDCTTDFSEEEASLLLEFIEKAGMLPPETGRLVTNYMDMGTMAENAWEQE